MLKLLSGSLFIRIHYCFFINACNVRESVDYESSKQRSVRNFIFIYAYRSQSGQSFEFRNLNEAIYVVVLKEKGLEFLKTSEFADVRWTNDVIKSYILE